MMRILILDDADREPSAIENAIRGREVEIRRAVFAGWTLEETARDLVSPAGRRST